LAKNVEVQKDRPTFSIPMDRGPEFDAMKNPPTIGDGQPQTHAAM